MIGVRVTDMHRASHGELEARISLGADVVEVTRRWGSWGIENVEGSKGWIEVVAPYTDELQRVARKFEKDEAEGGVGEHPGR